VPIAAVFDTNILFSATGWRGNPFQCVERARDGEIQAITCPELVEELAEKLQSRLHFSAEQVTDTLADYLGFLRNESAIKLANATPAISACIQIDRTSPRIPMRIPKIRAPKTIRMN